MPEPDGPVALEDERLNAVLVAAADGGSVDLRDTIVGAGELAALLEWAPADEMDCPILTDADFEGARFEGDTDFGGVVFRGGANFEGAVFAGQVRFANARFGGAARFADARFAQEATFEDAQFESNVGFTESVFCGDARFDHVRIGGEARFDEATFGGDVRFTAACIRGEASFEATSFEDDAHFNRAKFSELYARRAKFGSGVWFDDARFTRRAQFSEARFAGGAWFANARFGEHAWFNRAAFDTARDIGPLAVLEELSFADADFSLPVRIQAVARRATWQAARFRSGGDLSLGWTEVSLERSEFGGPSLIAALPAERADELDELLRVQGWTPHSERTGTGGHAPRVVSLRSAKLAELALSEVDLRACSFHRAQGLERLRLERVRFAESPSARSRHWPWRWTRRQTLAEEHRWRHLHGAWGWNEPETRAPDGIAQDEPPSAEELTGLYRALRNGRESIKDEPGAADFYYGEMEMRRQTESGTGFATRRTPAVERWLITLYWLVSGYALRSSRALLTLGLAIVVFAALFESVGFKAEAVQTRVRGVSSDGALVHERVPASDSGDVAAAVDALTYTAGTATAALAAPTRPLTRKGEILRVLLRIIGPILVGLALLSFRGRVKR